MKTLSFKSITCLLILALASCTSKPVVDEKKPQPAKLVEIKPEAKPLYVQHIVATGKGKTDSVRVYESDYLETTLSLYDAKDSTDYYRAGKKLEDHFKSKTDYKFVWDNITQADGKDQRFNNSTDFLNFMSERGYEMVDQKKGEYSIDYTFKKK